MQRILPVLVAILWSACFGLQAQIPFEARFPIAAGNDDAEEKINSGAMDISSSDLELVREASDQLIGLRFSDIPIPPGATINSAYIQFTVDETDDEPTTLVFHGELSPDAAPYTTTPFDISTRTRTTDSVVWADIPAWNQTDVATTDQRTPDLTALINELINQDGWEAGNALAFIITGTGKRTAISQNKNSPSPATLVINYDVTEFPVQPFPFGAESLWKYNDRGVALDTVDWTTLDFDDADWDFGQAKLGYGDGNENTTLDFGPDANNKIPTYYFRKTFSVSDASVIDSVTLNVLRDDGAIVYLNGQEVFRTNMPEGPVDFLTLASNTVGGSEEETFFTTKIGGDLLQNGQNVIAVEVHQASAGSSDLGFDLSVVPEVLLPPSIQLIHNAPDPSLAAVDIYVDLFSQGQFVNISGGTPLPFRFATPFLNDLPAGTHRVAISPFGQADFDWNATEITLENNKRYIAIASGVRNPALYDTTVNAGSDIAFQIQMTEVPDEALVSAGETFLLLDHGTPDLPNIRLIAPGVGDATADLPTGLPYNFPLLGGEVPSFNFPLVQVTNNLTDVVYGAYGLGLTPLTGQVVTVVTSGFFTAENNTGINSPNFGTFLITNAGGPFLPLPEPTPPTNGTIEIIHDAPDPGLSSVDIYVNGTLAVDSLDFRQSTGRIEIPAGLNRVAVAPAGTADTAWSATDVFIDFSLNATTLRLEGFDYSAAAYGLRDTTGFSNAANSNIGFGLALTEARTEAAQAENVDILFFHGSPNAPTVDFILDGQFIPLVNDLSFGSFSPIYASLPADDIYQVNVTLAEDNQQVVRAYALDLSGLSGQVLTLTASGQLGGEPGFGLFQADGVDADLIPLGEVVIDNVRDLQELGIRFFPNPVADQLQLDGPVRHLELLDLNGRVLQSYRKLHDQTLQIDLSSYPKGAYLLRIDHARGTTTAQLIKQ